MYAGLMLLRQLSLFLSREVIFIFVKGTGNASFHHRRRFTYIKQRFLLYALIYTTQPITQVNKG